MKENDSKVYNINKYFEDILQKIRECHKLLSAFVGMLAIDNNDEGFYDILSTLAEVESMLADFYFNKHTFNIFGLQRIEDKIDNTYSRLKVIQDEVSEMFNQDYEEFIDKKLKEEENERIAEITLDGSRCYKIPTSTNEIPICELKENTKN